MRNSCVLSHRITTTKARMSNILDENGQINYDYPGALILTGLSPTWIRLRSGKSITCKEYQFQLAQPREVMLEVKPAPVIIVEGLFVYYVEKLFNQLNLRLVIDAEDDIKLQRRITRDTAERGVPHEYVLYQWHNHVFLPMKNTCCHL